MSHLTWCGGIYLLFTDHEPTTHVWVKPHESCRKVSMPCTSCHSLSIKGLNTGSKERQKWLQNFTVPQHGCFFFCKYLLQDEIKHQNEAIKIHFIILTVKVNCLSTGVSKVLEGTVKRTTYWTPKWALERTWERTQHVVLNSAPRVRSNAYLKTYKINMSKWMLGI